MQVCIVYCTGGNAKTKVPYLTLDYVRNTRDYNQSELIFAKLAGYDVTRSASNLELTRLHYWKPTLKKQNLLKSNPNDKASLDLLMQVKSLGATWLKMASGFTADSQP